MRVDIISKEYPPAIYGGAGVHVAELVRALRDRGDVDVQVRCFGAPRDEAGTTAYPDLPELASANPALQTFGVDVTIAQDCQGADIVHSHTWYANLAGHLGGLLAGAPHVVTAHSLEPMRPWKAEQLGGGYRVSSFAERAAYEGAAAVIAVSAGMRADILRSYPSLDPAKVPVVHNGIDSQLWQPIHNADVCRKHGMDPDRPAVTFVGRITRQKGLPYLMRAAARLPEEVQVVLCAGAPDTPEIKAEVEGLLADLRAQRDGVVWIPEMLPRSEVISLLTASTTRPATTTAPARRTALSVDCDRPRSPRGWVTKAMRRWTNDMGCSSRRLSLAGRWGAGGVVHRRLWLTAAGRGAAEAGRGR